MDDNVINLKEGLAVGEPHPEAGYIRANRPDRVLFDQIVLRVIPRPPTSPMGRWTTSVRIELLKKGRIVNEMTSKDMITAVSCLPAEYLSWENSSTLPYSEKDMATYCDQEGCTNTATVAYKQINKKCSKCSSPARFDEIKSMSKFCDEHKWRGKNGTDDSMERYELIK